MSIIASKTFPTRLIVLPPGNRGIDPIGTLTAHLIKGQVAKKPNSVLGMATGSTMLGVYRELVQLCETNRLDLSECTAFNLDEYCGIKEEDRTQTYGGFMHQHLWGKIHNSPGKRLIPSWQAQDYQLECQRYERLLSEYGPNDLQLLGLRA